MTILAVTGKAIPPKSEAMEGQQKLAARVQEWILNTFPAAQERNVGFDDSLLDSGIIDSLGTLEVVNFLEAEFGIEVADDEMVADHFDSINSIVRFIESKQCAAGNECKTD